MRAWIMAPFSYLLVVFLGRLLEKHLHSFEEESPESEVWIPTRSVFTGTEGRYGIDPSKYLGGD